MITVLIVEDDPMVLNVTAAFLERLEGFRITGTAANGREALEILERERVNLILLDRYMPALDGLALLAHVRAAFPGVDVIMITASQESDDITYALRLGVVDYLVKPFTFERFQVALISYRERVRLLNSSTRITQETLDRRILVKQQPGASALPKGVERQTLALIKKAVEGFKGSFSIKDLAERQDLSRVSVKKYLDYLVESQFLESAKQYRKTGRPLTVYTKK